MIVSAASSCAKKSRCCRPSRRQYCSSSSVVRVTPGHRCVPPRLHPLADAVDQLQLDRGTRAIARRPSRRRDSAGDRSTSPAAGPGSRRGSSPSTMCQCSGGSSNGELRIGSRDFEAAHWPKAFTMASSFSRTSGWISSGASPPQSRGSGCTETQAARRRRGSAARPRSAPFVPFR